MEENAKGMDIMDNKQWLSGLEGQEVNHEVERKILETSQTPNKVEFKFRDEELIETYKK